MFVEAQNMETAESCGAGKILKSYSAADAAVTLSSFTSPKENELGHRVLPLPTSKEGSTLDPPSPLRLADVPEHTSNDSSAHAISLTSCVTKGVSYLSVPEDSDKAPLRYTEPKGISLLSDDCFMQQSRTCLGCFIESKESIDAEPGISMKIGDMNRDCDTCSVSDIGIQCMSTGESGRYGDQLLSDQLLSFTVHKSRTTDKRDVEKSDSESEDITQKHYYEGLLLDKCNGEEALLSNPSQDWAYFESFISESKIELLDLCSKNELSVNLFAEEEVDNYMFDDESTLSSDVCSLKIRYESFQDNVREKTNALQEEAQLSFFPNVISNCTKKEGKASVKMNLDTSQIKSDEIDIWDDKDQSEERSGLQKYSSTVDVKLYATSKRNHFFEANHSVEDSGEYSDDSYGTDSSYDTLKCSLDSTGYLSRQNANCSGQLNYALRAKRKVRYSDDYLYDVDSIENEKVSGKKEWVADGPKKEDDDEWCPRKRRKSARRGPPVIIKYIIINRFKGQKDMRVKVSKIDANETSVCLTEEALGKYEKLAPLKEFWLQRQPERVLSVPTERRKRLRLNSSVSDVFLSHPAKRKSKPFASRHRARRVRLELGPNKQIACSFDPLETQMLTHAGREEVAFVDSQTFAIEIPSCENGFCSTNMTSGTASMRGKPQGKFENRVKEKGRLKRLKLKAEAKLRNTSKKHKVEVNDDTEAMTNASEMDSAVKRQNSSGTLLTDSIHCAPDNTHSSKLCHAKAAAKNSSFSPATCSSDKTVPSANAAATMQVIPGGYLQTLLEASDSISHNGLSYFPNHSVVASKEQGHFNPANLTQSCVLSPPSESEQQSPLYQRETQCFEKLWHAKQEYSAVRAPAILPMSLDGAVSLPTEAASLSGTITDTYQQIDMHSDGLVLSKNYSHSQPLQSNTSYQSCIIEDSDGNFQLHRDSVATDDTRVISFDSVGSLSASSNNFSSLSLKSCENDGEDDMNDDFLAHCSPKLVIQQSIDEVVPLKESADLLDISNFTPDRFRQVTLSEISPPITPDLSPGIVGPEVKTLGKPKDFQEHVQALLGEPTEMKWGAVSQPHNQSTEAFILNNQQFQFHSFNNNDTCELTQKDAFDKQAGVVKLNNSRGQKPKRKSTSSKHVSPNQSSSPKGAKKPRKPKSAKAAEKTQSRNNLRQNPGTSKTPKKSSGATHSKRNDQVQLPTANAKSLDALISKNNISPCVQLLNESFPHCGPTAVRGRKQTGGNCTWPLSKKTGDGWAGHNVTNSNNLLVDDQREFEEPSNILSNIASGMAEVQRFMMASIEPIWSPGSHNIVSASCQSVEANSLKWKTLNILGGTTSESKRKSNSSLPVKNRRATAKALCNKNPAKCTVPHTTAPTGPSNEFNFSSGIRSGIFDRSSDTSSIPASNGPIHKKMYRHKATLKLSGDEKIKIKRAEREQQHKNPFVTASLEKLR
ncbi:neurite extension and migration factor [Hypanus sabinus]|uniref:neurite extension and migration factor n=1 Tax=Hypanus sabinus TaxID=79690 RepID=UPI0028C4B4AD|nr:neurite extension and migration factor [Hypanus sabinus]XP_059832826.1 neurite extension and migration factor [Hypanus sabinus]XP_059832827.1 neurite extension and migration factor [Hypanus sabinus]XP_059832828.1 neurite extension and migration factor [Hypanus sabinus]XP_059832829.1 neurite extension and migration factor [Hypanus sabinus]XP_059832830.1 neurite extension and migration factor [Hypanus sabinus]XP_059832831.1 neurite extension and migration factor [Hypanus sabinus]